MTFKRLLKVRKVLFPYIGDCFMTSVCCFSYFVIWVASLKERNDILCFIREERLYDVGSKEEADVLVFLHLFRVYYRSHDLHVQFQHSGTKFCVTI